MKTRQFAPYSRTPNHQRRPGTPLLSGAIAIGFALLPLAILVWAVPQTGLGVA